MKIVIPKLALFVKFLDEAIICPALKKTESKEDFKKLSANDKSVGEVMAASIANDFRISILRCLLINATAKTPRAIDRSLAADVFSELLNYSEENLVDQCKDSNVEEDDAEMMLGAYSDALISELNDTKIFDGFAGPLMEMVYEPLSAVLKSGKVVGFNVDLSFMLEMVYANGDKSPDSVTVDGFTMKDLTVVAEAENVSQSELNEMLITNGAYNVMDCTVAIVNGKMVCPYTYKITDPINTVVIGTVES